MIILLVILFWGIDFVSKLILVKKLFPNQSIVVINNFLNITYVKNTGAAWNIFDNHGFLVLVVSGIIIAGVITYISKNKLNTLIEKISYAMILGGAIGNFFDRIYYGYVIDFIDVNIFGYDYPIFNLADSFIVIGVILLLLYTWRCGDGNSSRRSTKNKNR